MKKLSINSIDNCMLVGFYLGDDKKEDFDTHLPGLAGELADIARDGLDFDGEHYEVDLCAGGDYKFVRSILGLQDGGNQTYGCSKCHCHKDDYGATVKEHRDGNTTGTHIKRDDKNKPVKDARGKVVMEKDTDQLRSRNLSSQADYSHKPRKDGSSYQCSVCNATIDKDHEEDR